MLSLNDGSIDEHGMQADLEAQTAVFDPGWPAPLGPPPLVPDVNEEVISCMPRRDMSNASDTGRTREWIKVRVTNVRFMVE